MGVSSRFSITYDDSFGAFLHYLVIQAALPLPASTTTLTSTTRTRTLTTTTVTSTTYTSTSRTEVIETTTTIVTTAAGDHWPFDWLWPTTTTTAGWWPWLLVEDTKLLKNSTTTTTSLDLSTVIYNHGTKSNASRVRKDRRKQKKKQKQREHAGNADWDKGYSGASGYSGGSCTCSCPVDQDFGRCYPLPDEMTFKKWRYGQEACDFLGAEYLLSERSCPDIGIVQPCESNSWEFGGGTRNLCGRHFWDEDMGLNCTQLTYCEPSPRHPIFVDTRRLATCSCSVLRWTCEYDSEPCDANDTYYPPGSSQVARDVLKQWSPPPPKPPATGWATGSWLVPFTVLGVLGLSALGFLRARRRAAQPDEYHPLT
ncbi:unnamed protein product [Symbiodinium natans]|uniref:Uncharacterized protein n=1 Tax=Symbiodinium natans TaxID=878477 RepID=A0A812NFK0_9DINO|nr:unnamed protein product [Symbiodinium natans]